MDIIVKGTKRGVLVNLKNVPISKASQLQNYYQMSVVDFAIIAGDG